MILSFWGKRCVFTGSNFSLRQMQEKSCANLVGYSSAIAAATQRYLANVVFSSSKHDFLNVFRKLFKRGQTIWLWYESRIVSSKRHKVVGRLNMIHLRSRPACLAKESETIRLFDMPSLYIFFVFYFDKSPVCWMFFHSFPSTLRKSPIWLVFMYLVSFWVKKVRVSWCAASCFFLACFKVFGLIRCVLSIVLNLMSSTQTVIFHNFLVGLLKAQLYWNWIALILTKWDCWWFRNPALIGSLSHDAQGFSTIPGGAGFMPSGLHTTNFLVFSEVGAKSPTSRCISWAEKKNKEIWVVKQPARNIWQFVDGKWQLGRLSLTQKLGWFEAFPIWPRWGPKMRIHCQKSHRTGSLVDAGMIL